MATPTYSACRELGGPRSTVRLLHSYTGRWHDCFPQTREEERGQVQLALNNVAPLPKLTCGLSDEQCRPELCPLPAAVDTAL